MNDALMATAASAYPSGGLPPPGPHLSLPVYQNGMDGSEATTVASSSSKSSYTDTVEPGGVPSLAQLQKQALRLQRHLMFQNELLHGNSVDVTQQPTPGHAQETGHDPGKEQLGMMEEEQEQNEERG